MSLYGDKITMSSITQTDKLALGSVSSNDALYNFIELHESEWLDSNSNGLADKYQGTNGTPSITDDGLGNPLQRVTVDNISYIASLKIPFAIKTKEKVSVSILIFANTDAVALRDGSGATLAQKTDTEEGGFINVTLEAETDFLQLYMEGDNAADYFEVAKIDIQITHRNDSFN